MHLFYQSQLPEIKSLDQDESKHCVKVLRRQAGDEINIIDGKGTFYKAKITESHPKKCEFEIIETTLEKTPVFKRHLAIAPTKNMDKMEWLVEKATEMGIDEISFFQSFHSERKVIKIDRLEKKVISAMKQSLKAQKPILNEIISYTKFLESVQSENKLIAYVDFENKVHMKNELNTQQDTLILIGPEGDFTPEEVDLAISKGFKKVSLGNSRLRTETAALAAVHLMNLAME
ncbi:16S rRNA (uracil(1498)-N(3))-methyltransferase [Marivirga salinae]|uniref:Ribosomal RNA small subunit methyltransferase E n=1 Tax=Marivirga salinarum TaxID=3059078 RepID=A0AA49GAE7_9BACT|nr:16S rRNA (uracil(1498)-N(3))-methyltransferase [Marivirga sp. BDSF4-3]WKK74064.2 16S rRNA (uracil(1498)-N(3))-methyltransferase [Marivirga sp. BDSF4-3]